MPALPFEELATSGVHALAVWLEDVVRDTTMRTAWLGELAALVDGTVVGDEVTLTLGIAAVTLGVRAVTGTDGHTRLTPSVGLKVAVGADAVVRADADLCTVDLGAGAAVALPRLAPQLVLGKRPDGGSILIDEAGPPAVRVETLRAGVALDEQHRPTIVVAADKVTIGSHEHDTLDLSSPDAVADAGGVVLGDVADEVLDRLGPAGDAVRALLGLDHPAGHPEVPTLDIGRFLQDPLGAVAEHWQTVVRDHPVAIPALLETLRDLMADAAGAAVDVEGTGTKDDPWRIVLAEPVDLEAWVEGETLTFGPAARLLVDTLGHGCTRIDTVVRVNAVALDLAGRHATFLPGIEATVQLRATDRPQAALITGRMAITADHIGFAARWSPGGGVAAAFEAPGLAIDLGGGPLPVPLPVIDANGNVSLDAAGWTELERLLGALAAAAGPPFLEELAEALGWAPRVRPPDGAAHLRLAELITDPGAELERWLGSLAVRDTELLHTALSMMSRLVGGTRDGGAGPLPGSGRPADPWLVPLAPAAGAPALAVWVAPDGPPATRDTTPTVIESWRPGLEGLDAASLADALVFEAIAADDVRDLLAGRPDLGGGLEALVTRWAGTDGRVVAPDTDPADVTIVRVPDATAADLPGAVDVAELLGREPATVVRVAVSAPDALPWVVEDGIPADRVIDLTTPGLAPAAFTPPAPAAGEWYVALGARQDARLASGDADGVQGQAERLGRVLDAFASLPGGLVVVADAAAGHAARRAAEAAAAVTDVITLGTPYGPVSFAVLDTQPAADALRLLARLVPAGSEDRGDDPDLRCGRGLVEGLVALLDLDDPARELAPPSPLPGAPRAGLTVTAVFGVVDEAAVRRAQTAIVAAGLALRDQARAAATPAGTPQALRVAVRVAVPTGAPSTGDVTVDGFAQVDVAGLGVSDAGALTLLQDRALAVHVALGRSGMWLAGGPDPGRAPGLRPEHELRRLSLDLALPLGGGARRSGRPRPADTARAAHVRDRARALDRAARGRHGAARGRRGHDRAARGPGAAVGGRRRPEHRHGRARRRRRGGAARPRPARPDRRERPRRDRPPPARAGRPRARGPRHRHPAPSARRGAASDRRRPRRGRRDARRGHRRPRPDRPDRRPRDSPADRGGLGHPGRRRRRGLVGALRARRDRRRERRGRARRRGRDGRRRRRARAHQRAARGAGRAPPRARRRAGAGAAPVARPRRRRGRPHARALGTRRAHARRPGDRPRPRRDRPPDGRRRPRRARPARRRRHRRRAPRAAPRRALRRPAGLVHPRGRARRRRRPAARAPGRAARRPQAAARRHR